MILTNAVGLARQIATLTTIPPPLEVALAKHDEALAVGSEPAINLAAEALTVEPGDVADLVYRAAADRALQSELPATRGEIVDLMARGVLRAASDAGPQVIDALRPAFTDAANNYMDAVRSLPADLRSEALLAAGPAAVAQYHAAIAAREKLDVFRKIRDGLADDCGVRAPGDGRLELWTRYLEIENVQAIDYAKQAAASRHPDLGRWQAWLTANGVNGLCWPTLDEQAQTIARLAATLPQRPPKKDPTIHLRGPKAA